MEIYMNKPSKQHFVFLTDIDGERFLAITPECKEKEVEFELFSDPETGDPADFITKGLISKSQNEKFTQYNQYRDHDRDERLNRFLEGMSKWEIRVFIKHLEEKIEQRKSLFS